VNVFAALSVTEADMTSVAEVFLNPMVTPHLEPVNKPLQH